MHRNVRLSVSFHATRIAASLTRRPTAVRGLTGFEVSSREVSSPQRHQSRTSVPTCVAVDTCLPGYFIQNNILIDERGVACLSDFGLSRIKLQTTTTVGPNSENQKQQGTARWMAPEHLAGGTASKKSDIYSFAMTIYEVSCLAVSK